MNKLTAEKCREQFEEWVTKGMSEMHKGVMLRRLECSDGYFHTVTRASWKAWQAAIDIALPILEQQERGECEWLEWGGGDCPVPEKSKVLVKWSDETVDKGAAGSWRWHHHEMSLNIIAYRIIPERATNQNGEQ